MSKIVVVQNAFAGGAGATRELVERLAQQYDVELQTPETADDLPDLVRRICAQGTQRIIAAGGDGTISRVANSLMPLFRNVELGVLPVGTGNDLARSLQIPIDDLNLAFEIAVTRPAIAIDLVGFDGNGDGHNDKYFINAATGGLGGEVTEQLQSADKQTWGSIAYWVSALTKLADLRVFEVQLRLDDEPTQERVYGIEIANGRYIGGGFPIASQALLNDGMLDVMIIPQLPTLELLSAGVNMLMGWAASASGILTKRAKRVEVHTEPHIPISIDGEPSIALDAIFEIVPGALKIVASDGAEAVARQA